MESPVSKVIRIAMDSDQIMKEHKASFPISVQIFEGEIDKGVEGQIFQMKSRHLI